MCCCWVVTPTQDYKCVFINIDVVSRVTLHGHNNWKHQIVCMCYSFMHSLDSQQQRIVFPLPSHGLPLVTGLHIHTVLHSQYKPHNLLVTLVLYFEL